MDGKKIVAVGMSKYTAEASLVETTSVQVPTTTLDSARRLARHLPASVLQQVLGPYMEMNYILLANMCV